MTERTRKLVGTLMCVGFLGLYCLGVMALGVWLLGQSNGMVTFVFWVVAGLAWLPIIMALIRWMSPRDNP